LNKNQRTNFNELVFWNLAIETYGTAIRVDKNIIRGAILFLCVAVPIILPIPLGVFICKFIDDITIRW